MSQQHMILQNWVLEDLTSVLELDETWCFDNTSLGDLNQRGTTTKVSVLIFVLVSARLYQSWSFSKVGDMR